MLYKLFCVSVVGCCSIIFEPERQNPGRLGIITVLLGMDTVYPEPMSLLHRRVVPKKRRGSSARYRTQPVTFSEIQVRRKNNKQRECCLFVFYGHCQ